MFLIVVYEERGHVVIDLDGHKIELSDMEAGEVAHSLLDAAKLCRLSECLNASKDADVR